ncbi:aromatic-ring-hydroxylating dioxygenase subunit beta [Sphingosinicella sp. CPCC 101087]|uniref:aromatic-ring-hydroxylating dioxygenase subunit beta n=1 Tax=Sphingosinicella sp. CPCC 101087 TaxID=2497754 RepID=UPI00101DF351|nr:aromatic-ring-hydroxylating dioxygenase subunit beta [Sphingosinicella sp. CPCC 101087]
MSAIDREGAEELLYREALALDSGAWDDWLALYTEDATFWVPAWRDEENVTQDPDSELSLIYYQGRRNLEDRVWRARSGLSVASKPRPRVVHAITNVLLLTANDAQARTSSSFAVHLYDKRSERTHVFFGRYEHALRNEAGDWRIAAKKIVLLNDVIPTVLDFYSI